MPMSLVATKMPERGKGGLGAKIPQELGPLPEDSGDANGTQDA